jgi:hypothetical protein
MKTRRNVLASALASLLVLAMSPMPAPIYMNIPAGETLKLSFDLPQAALCDGSVRVEKGQHEIQIRSMGDGTVRATINFASVNGDGKTCQATGKMRGHELVPAAPNAAGAPNAKPNANTPPTFATLGFTPQIRPTTQVQGNHLNVIAKGQGSNEILIGLLLPAVQKVREAAAAPAH